MTASTSHGTSRDARARAGEWREDDWERPRPTPRQRRNDGYLAVLFGVLAAGSLELGRSLGVLGDDLPPLAAQYALVVAGVVPLAWRRRFPILVMALTQAHFVLVGVLMEGFSHQVVSQVLCFFGLFSGVAWARNRQALRAVVVVIVLVMFGWVASDYVVGDQAGQILRSAQEGGASGGLLPPVAAGIVYSVLINAVFFGGAVLWGQMSWRSARRQALLAEQHRTIEEQAGQLRDRAVVEERLRIARELHDVVAHHVSVMGIQAAAARRTLDRRPEAASAALRQVERSSREAVGEMRALLSTLRTEPEAAPLGEPDRRPEPGLRDLPDLLASFEGAGLAATLCLDADVDDEAAVAATPPPVALTLYRIVQEGLVNSRRHSDADRAEVTVRIRAGAAEPFAEVEVVDDGRALADTTGSGLGLVGMRERVAHHDGRLETGPRPGGGYRVWARCPFVPAAGGEPEAVRTSGVRA